MDDNRTIPGEARQPLSASQACADLNRYARERDALLDGIVRVLERDRRVGAAWLSGSFGRGVDDEWSDLDLHVAVEDDHFAGMLEEREELYRRVGTPILIQHDMPSDSMAGGRFQLVMYRGPIEVDWNIGPAGRAARPAAHRMLFARTDVPLARPPSLTPEERRAHAESWLTFFWAMAPIAVKHCGRGDTRGAVGQIGLLTTAVIALRRLVSESAGPDPALQGTNRAIEAEIDAGLPRTGPTITPLRALRVVEELCIEVEGLHNAVGALSVAIPSAVPGEVRRLSAIASAVVREGTFPRRPYR